MATHKKIEVLADFRMPLDDVEDKDYNRDDK